MDKLELLAPAGNFEKLEMAIEYGADAVYVGGEEYSLRAGKDNFSVDELKRAVDYVHGKSKKIYIALNIIPHNEDIEKLEVFIKDISSIEFDGIILSDPGVLECVKNINPDIKIHLSTQANNVNYKSARFWYNQGVKRIVLARELSLKEVKEIGKKTQENLELEIFAHGSMCISYSGRCLLSNYMASRDSNKGLCCHPCRWKYHLVEEKRPGEYIPVFENERGTFIFNSKDLCMINHIPEIINSNVSSIKIEGRIKSSFYVATIVKSYREAIDRYYSDPQTYYNDNKLLEEISKVSHREFTTGFYFNKTGKDDQIYATSNYIREYDFIGIVLEFDRKTYMAKVEQRNRFFKGDMIEVVNPTGDYFIQKIENIIDEENNLINAARHPQMIVYIKMNKPVNKYTILRKQKLKEEPEI